MLRVGWANKLGEFLNMSIYKYVGKQMSTIIFKAVIFNDYSFGID